MRICLSINGNSGQARRASSHQLFKKDTFNITLSDSSSSLKYFFGYKVFEYLIEIQKRFEKEKINKYGQAQYGNGLRYGKIAVVGVIARQYSSQITLETFDNEVKYKTEDILNNWLGFEEFVKTQPDNTAYFRKYTDQETKQEILEVNFDNYYKGRTLTKDLEKYFV